jgi:integrase
MTVTVRPYRAGEKKGWEVDIRLVYPDGSKGRERRKAPVSARSAALRWGQARERELLLAWSRPKKKDVPSFRDFVPDFMANHAKVNNKPSEVTAKDKNFRVHLLPAFGSFKLDEIRARDIDRYSAKKLKSGLSPKTINNTLTLLRKTLATAQRWEIIETVPTINWLKVPPSEFRFLDFDEARKFLAAAEHEPLWYAMVLTAMRTGLRNGELRALRWVDVDLVAGKLIVRQAAAKQVVGTPKSHKHREVPLTDETVKVLRDKRSLMKLVFPHPDGRMWTQDECDRPLRRISRRAGLPAVSWHVLRHTFASHLAMRGAPMKAIQELLGHAHIATTLRYAHLSPSAKRDAVALLETPSNTSKAAKEGN